MQSEPTPQVEVARQLTGDLPCIVCRYNLRALSVLAVCPECGTPVRATVLSVVDPYAGVLQPLRWPLVTAMGIVVWSIGALGAALVTWAQRSVDIASSLANHSWSAVALAKAGTVMMVMSSCGALVLIRPHERLPRLHSLAAAGGIASMFASAVLYCYIHLRIDPGGSIPYIQAASGEDLRLKVRLLMGVLIIGSLLGLRMNARALASRSMLLRMGRVDRQTLRAMAAVVLVWMLGDVCRVVSVRVSDALASPLNTLGMILVAVASAMFTLGLVGVLSDGIRIARVIVRPPRSYHEVIGGRPADGAAPHDPGRA